MPSIKKGRPEMRMRIAMMVLVTAIAFPLPQVAGASCPPSQVIDNFSSGKYKATLNGVNGTGQVVQNGSMIGGRRVTNFLIGFNKFNQPATLDIKPKSSILIVGSGIRVHHRLEVFWGLDVENGEPVLTPLNLDLSCFSKFRVHFNANSVGVNFNMQVGAGNTNTIGGTCGVNQPGEESGLPFVVDFPFSCFAVNAGPLPDFSDIDLIDLVLQTGSAIGANDYGITLVEAVP